MLTGHWTSQSLDPNLKATYVELFFTTTANHHDQPWSKLLRHLLHQAYAAKLFALTFLLIFPFLYSVFWIPANSQKIGRKNLIAMGRELTFGVDLS